MPYNINAGSNWRKWDLHIHSPGTVLNNQFEGANADEQWEKYIMKLEQSDLKVIAPTNYFCIDGYEKLNEIKQSGKLQNIDLILPNIEFRLSQQNKDNQFINIHVIFSDKVSINKINDFLSRLPLLNTDGSRGAHFCNSEGLASVGYERAMVEFTELLEKLEENFTHLKDYLIVGVPRGHGGFRPAQNDEGRGGAYAEEIDKACDIFYGNEQDVQFFLGIDRFEGALSSPVVSCSDAHDLEAVGTKFTWIKADPTFEGLKQIIFVPEERVKIQQSSPFDDHNKLFFNALEIKGSKNFILPDTKLPLNRELVTVIGGRGTGKSALLEAIAFLNEEHLKADQNGKKKIIEYYRHNEAHTDPKPSFSILATLVDKDGNETISEKPIENTDNLGLPFLYIGQEKLSSIATDDVQLTRTICELLNVNVGEANKQSYIAKGRDLLSKLGNTQAAISALKLKYKELGFKTEDFEGWLKKYAEQLTAQLKRLSSKDTHDILAEVNKQTQRGLKLKDLNTKLENAKIQLQHLEINELISILNEDIGKEYPDLTKLALISTDSQQQQIIQLQAKINSEMDTLRQSILAQKTKLSQKGIKEDVNSLIQATNAIQLQINEVTTDLEQYKASLKALENLNNQKDALLIEVQNHLEEIKNQITSGFSEFQHSKDTSEEQEKELFNDLISDVQVEGEVVFNEKAFCEEVLRCIDMRSVPNQDALKKDIAGTNADGSAKDITFAAVMSWVKNISRYTHFNKEGERGVLNYVFTKWPEFINVRAVVKLNGKPTEILSVGQRGTLLLKVSLATSSAKQIFIIDQPEDNLDNSFVMKGLVPLIKKAKKSRQIILSTHNANLVVNADAEEVIVARLDQTKPYLWGAIENPEIKQNIQEILEGGEIAFKQRERRYNS